MCGHMTTAETSNTTLSVNNIKLIIIKYANESNKTVWHLGNTWGDPKETGNVIWWAGPL